MSVKRRLERLEDRIPAPEPPGRSEARERMLEHLDRIAALRLSDAPEDRAELEAVRCDVERKLAERRSRGRVVADGPLRRY